MSREDDEALVKVYRVLARPKGSDEEWVVQRYLMSHGDYLEARSTIAHFQDGMFDFEWQAADLVPLWRPVEPRGELPGTADLRPDEVAERALRASLGGLGAATWDTRLKLARLLAGRQGILEDTVVVAWAERWKVVHVFPTWLEPAEGRSIDESTSFGFSVVKILDNGGADLTNRLTFWAQELGTKVVVENRPPEVD